MAPGTGALHPSQAPMVLPTGQRGQLVASAGLPGCSLPVAESGSQPRPGAGTHRGLSLFSRSQAPQYRHLPPGEDFCPAGCAWEPEAQTSGTQGSHGPKPSSKRQARMPSPQWEPNDITLACRGEGRGTNAKTKHPVPQEHNGKVPSTPHPLPCELPSLGPQTTPKTRPKPKVPHPIPRSENLSCLETPKSAAPSRWARSQDQDGGDDRWALLAPESHLSFN